MWFDPETEGVQLFTLTDTDRDRKIVEYDKGNRFEGEGEPAAPVIIQDQQPLFPSDS